MDGWWWMSGEDNEWWGWGRAAGMMVRSYCSSVHQIVQVLKFDCDNSFSNRNYQTVIEIETSNGTFVGHNNFSFCGKDILLKHNRRNSMRKIQGASF